MPSKYGFGNSRKKSPFKLKGMDFGTGTGSSPLNKYKSDAQRKAVHASKADKSPMKKVKPDYPDIDGDGNRKESMKKAASDKAPTNYGMEEEETPLPKTSPLNQVRGQQQMNPSVEVPHVEHGKGRGSRVGKGIKRKHTR
tara:strand:+ start:55 stop:474 length:420 start_codon:yes stop_codon:yes gene_type:complete